MAPGHARRGTRVPVRSSGRMLQSEMSQDVVLGGDRRRLADYPALADLQRP